MIPGWKAGSCRSDLQLKERCDPVKKNVKSTLSILLALVMILSILPVSAFADEPEDEQEPTVQEPAETEVQEEILPDEELPGEIAAATSISHGFTRQPESGSVPADQRYDVTWETDFEPVRAALFAWEQGTEDPVKDGDPLRTLTEAELAAGKISLDPVPDTKLVLAVWFGEGEEDYVLSDPFTVTADVVEKNAPDPVQDSVPAMNNGTRSAHNFTTQPVSGGFDPELLRYPLYWVTDFVPLRYEVWQYIPGDGWNRLANVTSPEQLSSTIAYWIMPKDGAGEYYVRVFFGSGDADYVESDHVTVSASTLLFTAQPTGTLYMNPDTLKYAVSWTTNFTPEVIEIVKKSGNYYDDTIVQLAANGRSGTYNLPVDAEEGYYRLNAYYYFHKDPTGEEGNGNYVVSQEFFISNDNLAFTVQPAGVVQIDPDTLEYTVSWETNFIPEKVEIVRETTYSTKVYYSTRPTQKAWSYSLPASAEDYTYEIVAYYDYEPQNEEDEGLNGLYVCSNSFTISASNLAFTSPPASVVQIDPDTLRYVISWETNFTPERMQIIHTTSTTDESVVQMVPHGHSGTYNLGPSANENYQYELIAYYDYEPQNEEDEGLNGHYILAPFTISASNLAFTKQPDSVVYIDPLTMTYPVSWTLNFYPPVIQIDRWDGEDDTTVRELWSTSNDFTCYLPLSSDRTASYSVYAYYDYEPENEDEGKGGHGFYSQGFHLSTDNLVFTDPPCIYDTIPERNEYIVRWATNFVPSKVQIFHQEPDPEGGEPITVVDDTLIAGYDTVGYWVAEMQEVTYFVAAFYGPDGEGGFIFETIDMETPDFGFTVSPQGGEYIEGTAVLPISWTTNFTPVRVAVASGSTIVHEIHRTMNRSMSYDLPATLGEDTFRLCAWYANEEDKCVVSEEFHVSYPGLMFTKQPLSGGASEHTPHEIHWQTNFEPEEQELRCLYSGGDVKIGTLTEGAQALAVDCETAILYPDGLFYILARFGEETITSTTFHVWPRLDLDTATVDALDGNGLFSYQEYEDEWGDTYGEYVGYVNNATDSAPIHYCFTVPESAQVSIGITLLDETFEAIRDDKGDTLYVSLGGSNGLPAGIIVPVSTDEPGMKAYEVNTASSSLRRYFHEAALARGLENPDLFSVMISVTVEDGSGEHEYDLKLHDIHLPMRDPGSLGEEFFKNFTLSTPLGPGLDFPLEAPAVSSVSADWYTVIMTAGEGVDLPGAYQPEWEGQSVWEYFNPGFWSYYDEETEEWDELSVPEAFARLFGEGVNFWGYGPVNDAPRGPDNFVFGIAANKLTRTGTSLADASFRLTDLMNEENREYFESLPGLSSKCYDGGYWNEGERPDSWEEVYYEYMASIRGFLTVTFADGVTYKKDLQLVRGEDGQSSFQVSGNAAELDLEFRHSCSFDNNLTVNYYVPAVPLEGCTDLRLVVKKQIFNADGSSSTWQEVELTDYVDKTYEGEAYKVFSFGNIAATEMGNELCAVLYAERDGETVQSNRDLYSVKNYAFNRLDESENAYFKRLMVDMLNYGAKAQLYFGYNTGNLVNAGLSPAQQALGTSETPTLKSHAAVVETPGATADFYGQSVVFGSNLELKYYMTFAEGQDMTNVRLELSYETELGTPVTISIPAGSFVFDSRYDAYSAKMSSIAAKDVSCVVTAKIYDGNTLISNEMNYSIETYAYNRLQKSTNEEFKALVIDMMKYGNSAKEYFEHKQ